MDRPTSMPKHCFNFFFFLIFSDTELDFYVNFGAKNGNISQTQQAAQQFMESSRKFQDCQIVDSAGSTLLKFKHIETGFTCNLQFSRYVDVHKGKILTHLLSLDPRIYDLAFIIKYWMKYNGFNSSNGINSYAALWLLFFYLQQLKEPILPPIKNFQMNATKCEVNGANVAFDYQMEYSTKNEQPMSHLLFGFFSFYKKFDFVSQIICPEMGSAMARTEFMKLNAQYFLRYSTAESELLFDQPINIKQRLCIQDPFEKRRSFPENVSPEFFHTFREAITFAAEICRSTLNSGPIGQDCLMAMFGNDAITTNRLSVNPINIKAVTAMSKLNHLPASKVPKRTAMDNILMVDMASPPKRALRDNNTVNCNGANVSNITPNATSPSPSNVTASTSNGGIRIAHISSFGETGNIDRKPKISQMQMTPILTPSNRGHTENNGTIDVKPKVMNLASKQSTPQIRAMNGPIISNVVGATNSVKSIQILPNEEAFKFIESYVENVWNLSEENVERTQTLWARFSVHFLVEILHRICRTKRRQIADQFNLPKNSPFSKKIVIDGLYDIIYQNKRTNRLAIRRKAQIEITEISVANITCHIYSNRARNIVTIDLYNEGTTNFELFYKELQANIRIILSSYFEKILNYVLFEPRTEILNFSKQDPSIYDDGVKTEQNDIRKDLISFKHDVTPQQLNCLETFLQKVDSAINLDQHNMEIRKIWAQLCIDFTLDILTKIFGFKLGANERALKFSDSNYSKTFDVTGVFDVFYRRAQYATNNAGVLFKEMKKTLNALMTHGQPFDRPLRAIFHIWTDSTNYNAIIIDIYNLRQVRRYDPMNNFWNEFRIRVTPLINDYFEKLMDDYIILSKEFNLAALCTNAKNKLRLETAQQPRQQQFDVELVQHQTKQEQFEQQSMKKTTVLQLKQEQFAEQAKQEHIKQQRIAPQQIDQHKITQQLIDQPNKIIKPKSKPIFKSRR